MPDHPDDAPKRQQRGVLPPFLAPRSARGEGPSVPASGSWRRVSRLFTPPDVARQRGAAVTPAKPFTPPSTPVTTPPAMPPALTPLVTPEPAPPVTSETAPPVTLGSVPTVGLDAPPVLSGFPFDLAEPTGARSFDEIAWPPADDVDTIGGDQSRAAEGGDQSPAADDRVFAADDDGGLVVESLERDPISLAMPDPTSASAEAGIERLVADELPDTISALSHADVDQGPANEAPAEYGPSLPTDEESWGAGGVSSLDDSWEGVDAARAREAAAAWDEAPAPAAYESDPPVSEATTFTDVPAPPHDLAAPGSELAAPPNELAPSHDEPSVADVEAGSADGMTMVEAIQSVGDALGTSAMQSVEHVESEAERARDGVSAMPVESDPWADIELTEPAFGATGWPPSERGAVASDEEQDAAPAPVDSRRVADVGDDLSPDDTSTGTEVLANEVDDNEVDDNGVDDDEMTAALAWSDAARHGQDVEPGEWKGGEVAGEAKHDAPRDEDAFSAVADELRDSSSAWAAIDDPGMGNEHVSLAGFSTSEGGTVESTSAPAGFQEREEAVETGARPPAGSAIADALARVAERIRAGEVELSSEAAGASDESALAAALAALLRGPRRD